MTTIVVKRKIICGKTLCGTQCDGVDWDGGKIGRKQFNYICNIFGKGLPETKEEDPLVRSPVRLKECIDAEVV